MKITYEKLKIINALKEGPKTWTELRNVYYEDKGIDRINSNASTSFYNQLKRMQEGGLIIKCEGGYTLPYEPKSTRDILADEQIDQINKQK